MEVEPSLFVDYCGGDQSSSPSWQRVHFDPPASTEVLDVGKMSNNLTCFPCEGLILQTRYCRALVFIGTSSGLIDLGGGDGSAQVNQGLESALREAVAMLSLVLEQTSLCWLEVTVRISIYSLKVLANKHLPQKYETQTSAPRCHLGPVHIYTAHLLEMQPIYPHIGSQFTVQNFVTGSIFKSPWFQIESNPPIPFCCVCWVALMSMCKIRNIDI